MKKRSEKKSAKGVVKGAPSGFVISLMVHAAAFMLAGLLVVFTVHQKEEKKFVPPKPVDRPKMKLKKPKVKVKKSAKPKPTTRIVTKVKRASMPDIQLPEMSGIGDGLVGGVGGFEIMPDLSDLATPFGGKITTGSELEGQFFNLNRDRRGRPIMMSPETMVDKLYDFMAQGWKRSKLAQYYRAPEKLYSPTICVPTVLSELAPQAFGMEDAEGYCWAVLYEGSIVYPEDITFRFWGVGDKIMAVSVDGETVLICAYRSDDRALYSSIWQSNHPKDNTYYFGEHRARPSDWITLKAGEEKDIQVLLADTNGGLVYHMLSVEVEGEEYPFDRGGYGPTFPIFKTAELTRDMQDVIYANLYPGDACLTNGPIFNDFDNSVSSARAAAKTDQDEKQMAPVEEDKMRVWTVGDGKTLEAEFRIVIAKHVVLQDAKGKQHKILMEQLSDEDREYIVFAAPPTLDINFFKKSEQIPNPPVSPWVNPNQRPLQMFNYTFGARIKQVSAGDYSRELMLEYYAVGEEVDGDNYVLLDYNTSSYTPTKENRRSHEFSGDKVELMRMAYRDSAPVRGIKYGGYLVLVKDERGKLIQYAASHEFLYENLSNLKKLKPRNHFDRNCLRTIPARPTEDSRGPGAVDGN